MPTKRELKAPKPQADTDKGLCLADIGDDGQPTTIFYAIRLPSGKSTNRTIGEYVRHIQDIRRTKHRGSVICDCRIRKTSNSIVGVWVRRTGQKTIGVNINGETIRVSRAAFRQMAYHAIVSDPSGGFDASLDRAASRFVVGRSVVLKAYQAHLDAMAKRDKPESQPTLADDVAYFRQYGGAWSEYRHSAEFEAALAHVGETPQRQGDWPTDVFDLRYGAVTRYGERFNCTECQVIGRICTACERKADIGRALQRLGERQDALLRATRDRRAWELAIGRDLANIRRMIPVRTLHPFVDPDWSECYSDLVREPTDLERWGEAIEVWIRRIECQGNMTKES